MDKHIEKTVIESASAFISTLLLPLLDEMEKTDVEMVEKLITEDAPKNKFSVVSGKHLRLKEIRDEIVAWKSRIKQ
jgi:hypothetical protein